MLLLQRLEQPPVEPRQAAPPRVPQKSGKGEDQGTAWVKRVRDACPEWIKIFGIDMKPPEHLRPATRRWFSAVLRDFALEDHHIRLLTRAAEAWDRGDEAREAIAAHGLTFNDRFGTPRARPEVAIERDSRTGFARLLRELDLDIAGPETTRPPALRSNRR